MTMAGLDGAGPVVCSRNVSLVPDKDFAAAIAAAPYDVIVLPGGGKGSENLCKVS